MATIDKSLPNTKTEIEIPGQEEIIETQQEIGRTGTTLCTPSTETAANGL